MGLMDTDSHKDMSDRLTQVSADQKMQEASYVQSPPTPVQVLHSYHVPPHSPAHDSGPGSLDSLVLDTPINTLVASSMGRYVKPGSEDRQRKRLRDWQSTLTGFKGQGFHPEPSHLDRGILEFGHPRAPQMNQMSPSYTSTRFKIHRNEGQQPKLARNGKKIPAVNQGQGIIYNKIIHYPEYSMADLGSYPMNREIQSSSHKLTVNQYMSRQASEGQPNQPLKLLQYKSQENPTEMVQILSGDDLKNHIMEILRPHLPQTVPENLDDIKPPTEPLNLLSYIIQKLSSGDQIKPYKAFYQDRMVNSYQDFEASTNLPVVKKIGDWDFFMVQIQQDNIHPSDLMGLIIPSTTKGKLYTNSGLYSIFTSIQNWLTKVHSILWKHFKGDISPKADHQRMMLWFFQEVFNPQYGIPILGKVYIQNWINAPLGPLQIWLMKLLQANQSIYTTAVAISAIWFKETLSQQWAMHFQDDYHFWGFANNFFITHILPIEQQLDVSKLNQALGNFRYNSHKSSGIWDLGIGDFKVTSPPHSIHIIRKRPTPRAEASIKILNKQKHLHSLARGARDIHAKNKDLGIAIAKYCQGVDDYFYIRVITKETEKLTSPDDQRRSLSSFVDSLDAYSSFMISSLFTPSRPQNFHQEIFLDWVHLKLFGNDADSILPIQGRVDQSFFNQPIVPTFDEVQIFILENNCRQMNTKNLHAALVLFGYWLKTEHKEIWNEEFETDEAFSRFVYNLKWTSF
ncbi:hypothetical protein H4Q26_017891 [Puccinia striiformis f. sp. tritici PST-130]|nr:hypothetical protein Pst134EB_023347 [Puccinia striiformis f. sp. tritici]KAI9626328.1 hypothetical protein H4Q26_017891 [Puccinia striiformis f. sp. tritici PST-130]